MPWWRSFIPWRSDDEISAYVAGEVTSGRIKPEFAEHLERNLRDEADGKTVIMRNPGVEKIHAEKLRQFRAQIKRQG